MLQGALRERVQHPVEHRPIFLSSHRFLSLSIEWFGFSHFDNWNILMDDWEFVFEPCASLLEAQKKMGSVDDLIALSSASLVQWFLCLHK